MKRLFIAMFNIISNFSVESCQSEVCEVKRDMIAIKHEIDSVQLVKDEIDDIRESLDRLEAESQRRKNKLLEQVKPLIKINKLIHKYFFLFLQGLTFFLAYSIFSAVLGMLQFGYNTGVINAPEQVFLSCAASWVNMGGSHIFKTWMNVTSLNLNILHNRF